MTVPVDTERLRALAEAAQAIEPGPWRIEEDGHDSDAGWVAPHGAFTRSREVNEYMAAASPDRVLALLAALDQARREREGLLAECDAAKEDADEWRVKFQRALSDGESRSEGHPSPGKGWALPESPSLSALIQARAVLVRQDRRGQVLDEYDVVGERGLYLTAD